MGYELNQLMKRYGLSTATMSPYSGMGAPTALAADATADQRNQFVTDSGNYMAQKAAYDQYKNDYQGRIASTSAYQDSPLFKGEKKSWDAPLKTPNYSLATPKTDADYAPLINDAFAKYGRVGMGDKLSNIDQPTYDSWMYRLKTGDVPADDFGATFTKSANDYFAKNPDTDLTKYAKGYFAHPKDSSKNSQTLLDMNFGGLGQMPYSSATTGATPAGTMLSPSTASAVLASVTPTPTEEEDPYVYVDNFGGDTRNDFRDSARGGHIKYAHGGPVHNFSGGGYNKIDGGIDDLVGKYDLANPTELPVMMAKNDTGTMTDAAPASVAQRTVGGSVSPPSGTFELTDDQLRKFQESAAKNNEQPIQRGPAAPVEGAPVRTEPSPAGGATLGAAPASAAAPSGQTPLEVLHQKYLNAGRQPKSAEMTAAEQKYASKNDALINLLKEQANKTEDNAPSKAEMYFRLAAALAAPTKTGAFTENMGLAAKELADFQKSTTDAKKAAAAAKLQLLLKTGEIDAQQAKEELANLKEGEKEGRDVARTFAMKEYETTSKLAEPQTADEKEAIALGKKKGTPEFTQFIQDRENRRRAKEDTELGIKQSAEQRAAAVAKQKSEELTPKQADLRDKTKEQVAASTQAIQDLRRALTLNENAYDNSTVSTAQRKLLEAVDSKAPKLVNTQELEVLLGEQMVARLKSSFGGQPSNKESEILAELQGARAKNNETRKRIIARAILVAQERLENEKSKLADINAKKWQLVINPEKPADKPAAEGSE
jgi:hypothetical protein